MALIEGISAWEHGSGPMLEQARALIAAASPARPLLVDPFSGGGSIPLEGLRLGCDAFAADLNPVAVTGLQVLLEDAPRHSPALADALTKAGELIQADFAKAASDFFGEGTGGYRPIAYLWARTAQCEAPNCGMAIPLLRSLWLAKKAKHPVALRYVVDEGPPPELRFEVFFPKTASEVKAGTIQKALATCPRCGTVLPAARVHTQLSEQKGGANTVFDKAGKRSGGATLVAVVLNHPAKSGREFRVATKADYARVESAQKRLQELTFDKAGLLPTEALPPEGTLGFNLRRYGLTTWRDLFTDRQALTLLLLRAALIKRASGDPALGRALALAFNRVAMSNMSLTRWNPSGEKIQHTFGRQAMPIVWDFAEVVPYADAPGNWKSGYQLVDEVMRAFPGVESEAHVEQANAREFPLPDATAAVWFTDPPYYDAVPYADLSDFFYVWLKRVLPQGAMRSHLGSSEGLTPKEQEAVQDLSKVSAGRKKDKGFFEEAMAEAFAEGRRCLSPDGIACVVFAHKSTEGWEALLGGMIRGGWLITATWPIATEMRTRLRAQDSASLGTSIHLVCRPRPVDAPVGDWAEVVRELPERVRAWMDRLSAEGVRGADLVFACIGPAMEIFSRFSKVVDSEEREIPLGGDPSASNPHERGYLSKVWEVVGKSALERVLGGATDGGSFEEDARLTALFLWTAESTVGDVDEKSESAPDESDAAAADDSEDDVSQAEGPAGGGVALPFDVVRRFAQPLGISLEDWEGRIIKTKKGVVRLLPVRQRSLQLLGTTLDAITESGETPGGSQQTTLFEEEGLAPTGKGKRNRERPSQGHAGRTRTTLDRVHLAMLYQAAGESRQLMGLWGEERKKGKDFDNLANALAALYPRSSEERRLVEALLLAAPK